METLLLVLCRVKHLHGLSRVVYGTAKYRNVAGVVRLSRRFSRGSDFISYAQCNLKKSGVVMKQRWSLHTIAPAFVALGILYSYHYRFVLCDSSELEGDFSPEEQQSANDKLNSPNEQVEYTMIVFNKATVEKLRTLCNLRHPDAIPDNLVIVQRKPESEALKDLDDLLDTQVDFTVIGTLENSHCQLVSVALTFAIKAMKLVVESEHLHIQPDPIDSFILLSSENKKKFDSHYARALIARFLEAIGSKEKSIVEMKSLSQWEGPLKDPVSSELENASFEPLSSADIHLYGTFCADTLWDKTEMVCRHRRENQCAFCIFMKGGPCRKEFIAWEKCVDVPKFNSKDDDDDDFIDRCANQTLELKACVDNNPDYYYMVSENEEDEETVSKAKEAKSKKEKADKKEVENTTKTKEKPRTED